MCVDVKGGAKVGSRVGLYPCRAGDKAEHFMIHTGYPSFQNFKNLCIGNHNGLAVLAKCSQNSVQTYPNRSNFKYAYLSGPYRIVAPPKHLNKNGFNQLIFTTRCPASIQHNKIVTPQVR